MSTCEGTGFRGEVRGCVRIAAVLCAEWGRAIFGRDGGAGQVPVNLRVSYWWHWSRDYRITVSLSVWVKCIDLLVKKLYSRSEAMNRYKLIPALMGPCAK